MPALSLVSLGLGGLGLTLVGGVLGWWARHQQAVGQQRDVLHQAQTLWEAQSQAKLTESQAQVKRLNSDNQLQLEKIEALKIERAQLRQQLHDDTTHWTAKQATLETELAQLKAHTDKLQNQWQQQFEKFLNDQGKVLKQSLQETADREFNAKQTQFTEKLTHLVKPLTETLTKVQDHVAMVDKQHHAATQTVQQELMRLSQINTRLSQSLSHNKGRGDWGEQQLISLLENSGFVEGQGYVKQEAYSGGKKRPDIRIILPDNKSVFVDSKALQVMVDEPDDDGTEASLKAKQQRYAASLKEAIKLLASKQYQDELPEAVNFVVLYVPLEGMLSLAISGDPAIVEMARRQGVILASPFNLMAMLHVIKQSAQFAKLNQDAQQILALGTQLYSQVKSVQSRMEKLGRAVGTLESAYMDVHKGLSGQQGVLKKVQKLEEYGCDSGSPMAEELSAPELLMLPAVSEENETANSTLLAASSTR